MSNDSLHPVYPSEFHFVVKLRRSDDSTSERLIGRLEHLQSGRRHEFDSGRALLSCLVHEKTLLIASEPDTPG